MTGHEFRKLRTDQDFSLAQFGLLLGYKGNLDTIIRQVRDYEGRPEVPEHVARLAFMLHSCGVPPAWMDQATRDLTRLNAERDAVRAVRAGG